MSTLVGCDKIDLDGKIIYDNDIGGEAVVVMSPKKCISIRGQFLELNRKMDAMRESRKEEVASVKHDISTLKDEISTLQEKTEFIMKGVLKQSGRNH